MAKILLDSDAVIAMAKGDDASHQRAVELEPKLAGNEVYITSSVIMESITLLRKMVGKPLSSQILDGLLTSDYKIISPGKELLLLARKYFDRQNSKRETMFDCVNMAVAEVYNIDAIFSFDKGYIKNKFKLLK